jgi:hypothetical protein
MKVKTSVGNMKASLPRVCIGWSFCGSGTWVAHTGKSVVVEASGAAEGEAGVTAEESAEDAAAAEWSAAGARGKEFGRRRRGGREFGRRRRRGKSINRRRSRGRSSCCGRRSWGLGLGCSNMDRWWCRGRKNSRRSCHNRMK